MPIKNGFKTWEENIDPSQPVRTTWADLGLNILHLHVKKSYSLMKLFSC